MIWIADAHRGDGERFIVRADEKLTIFLGVNRRVAQIVLTFSPRACQSHIRAKSVGRLQKELHLTRFPQGNPRANGSLAQLKLLP